METHLTVLRWDQGQHDNGLAMEELGQSELLLHCQISCGGYIIGIYWDY